MLSSTPNQADGGRYDSSRSFLANDYGVADVLDRHWHNLFHRGAARACSPGDFRAPLHTDMRLRHPCQHDSA